MWSPDGSQIAFVGGGGQDDPARYPAVVSVDGTGLTRLSDTLYVDEHGMPGPPAWSPDGDRIAFLEPGGRDAQLVVSSVDGVDKIRIDLGVIAGALRWSPDGSLLAFTGLREGADHASVYTVAPVQDAEPHELAEGTDPVWSPDGSRLAFLVACCSEGWAIHIVGPDGSNDHELKTSQVYPWGTSLIWSLDSSSVAYTGAIGMSSIGMWVAAADGSGASRVEGGQDSWVFAEPLT
jgi:Tol biopolymer transport system component